MNQKKRFAGKTFAATVAAMMMMASTSMTALAQDEFDVIYVTPCTASMFWNAEGIGMKNAALDLEEEKGITINFTTVGPADQNHTEEYVTAFEQAIAKMPDSILTSTLFIAPTIPKAVEATSNGIVLNFINCGLGSDDDGAYADAYNQFYYCSNDTIGEMAAEAFLELMEKKGIDTSEGVVGIFMNHENEALDHRINSFRDYLAEHAPGLTLTDTYYNDNVLETAQSQAENVISTYGDKLVGLYSGTNISGDGACLAVQSAGIGDKIVNVVVDSDDTEIEALKNGNADAIVVQDAYKQGYLGMVNAIETLLNGSNPEEKQQINVVPILVTSENMDDPEIMDIMDPTRIAR